MSSESYPGSDNEKLQQAWATIDSLLPEQYEVTGKKGSIRVDNQSGSVLIDEYQRWRVGNAITSLIARSLLSPLENYEDAYRSVSIGKLPNSFTNRPMPPKLGIYDHLYTPTNPVEGLTRPVRSTEVVFIYSADDDAEGRRHEDGITFKFLETNEFREFPVQVLRAGYYSDTRLTVIREYLSQNDLPTPYSHEVIGRETELLDFCISEAQKS